MSIEELNEKAMTGRKLSWEELAQELEATQTALQDAKDALTGSEKARLAGEQKLAAYQDQMDAVITGFAALFPTGGWKVGDHPELGDMTEEFASSVVSKAADLQAEAARWKSRLVEDTERLRQAMASDRNLLGKTLCENWPDEFSTRDVYLAEIPVVQRVVDKLLHLKGHGDNNGYAMAMQQVRQSAMTAVFLANQRNIRASKFMSPGVFAQTHYAAYRDAVLKAYPESGLVSWDGLDEEAQRELLDLAEVISKLHTEAMNEPDGPDDPVVVELLSGGDALTKSINMIEDLRKQIPYRHLEELDEWLSKHFPRQVINGDDAALDAVRRAIEILSIFHTHAPTMIKHAWENVIRPAIHVLEGMGIDILPPGTIVYGTTQASTKPHRPV